MLGFSASAREAMSSGAVLPVAANCSLFCTVWNTAWVSASVGV